MVFQATPVPAAGRHPMIPNTTMTFGCATGITFPSANPTSDPLTLPSPTTLSVLQRLVDQPCQYFGRIEVFHRKCARRLGMPGIVGFNILDGRNGLFHGRKCEEPLAHGKHRAEAGVLHGHWPTSSQIA